ncbi:hypothetical protein [Arenimonas oryziterrae]|uniref:Uncharacterized protein n=1 Tax=Arenimonas oryziterrae DSM 21050 = YC6267 TaxID=1121015 RepID=A0A091AWM4_9GAMM|nr:hypothetical protein [Arenimonas oryziterrae]KFN43682.1 hypothetical protein N789_10420 [Arenimonas oryziterrae DSM 21050 = YC6267]
MLTREKHAALESEIASLIGKMVLVMSRFEINLNLSLRGLLKEKLGEDSEIQVSNMNLKDRIDRWRKEVATNFADDRELIASLDAWHVTMTPIREKRNRFIHGYWIVDGKENEVVNLTMSIPGSPETDEIRLSLDDLRSEVQKIEDAVDEFFRLRRKWSF